MADRHTRKWVVIKAAPGTRKLPKDEQRWAFHKSGDQARTRRIAKAMTNEGRYEAMAVMRKNLNQYGVKS